MAITRLGSSGHGTQRAGPFSGKASSGAHPVALITRLSGAGYGTRRAGSFAGKATGGAGAHPVALITRLASAGHATRRAGSFAGKTPAIAVAVPPESVVKGGRFKHWAGKRRVLALPRKPRPELPATEDEIEDLLIFFDLL